MTPTTQVIQVAKYTSLSELLTTRRPKAGRAKAALTSIKSDGKEGYGVYEDMWKKETELRHVPWLISEYWERKKRN